MERGFGLGIHANDDDEGDKSILSDYLGLPQRPICPLLRARGPRPLLRSLGALPGLAFPLARSLRSHRSRPRLRLFALRLKP